MTAGSVHDHGNRDQGCRGDRARRQHKSGLDSPQYEREKASDHGAAPVERDQTSRGLGGETTRQQSSKRSAVVRLLLDNEGRHRHTQRIRQPKHRSNRRISAPSLEIRNVAALVPLVLGVAPATSASRVSGEAFIAHKGLRYGTIKHSKKINP